MATEPLPPNDEREEWIKRNVRLLRGGLSEPTTRRRLLELLDGHSQRRSGTDDETPKDS